MTKKRRSSQAVSEVVGVILLLGITIGLFGFLNYVVFSFSFQPSAPSVNLIGSIDKTNGIITIEHNGGESLDGKTQIIITIGNNTYQKSASELLLKDTWNFGETVQFPYYGDITGSYIRAIVMDPSTNTLILSAVLQQGSTASVITNDPPTFTSPDPTGGGIPITTTLLSITIQDPEGDPISWTITTSPNIGTSSGNNELNGTKTCTIAGLTDSTTYTWTVKAYDGHHWTNKNYLFTTSTCPAIDTSTNKISPYVISTNPLTITAAGDSDLDNVTLYYQWSDDNISWNGGLNELKDSVNSNTSNMDPIADKGLETNFANAQDKVPDTDFMTITEATTGLPSVNEHNYVDSFTVGTSGWTSRGTTPYIAAIGGGKIYTANDGAVERWFTFTDTASTGDSLVVALSVYPLAGDGGDDITYNIDTNGDNAAEFTGTINNPVAGLWFSSGTISGLTTHAQVNAARVSFTHTKQGGANNITIDCAQLNVTRASTLNNQIDLEYQWTAAKYNQANKQVCLYVDTYTGTENLLVNYWTGSTWSSLGTITTTGWSNFTATGLSSSTYAIQLKGATESGDSTQDSWNVDVIMLHTWNTTGGSHGQNWIIWSNPNNPDTSLPWSWTFDFPKGVGYYEFYSIGKDLGHCGGDIEPAPINADARCRKI